MGNTADDVNICDHISFYLLTLCSLYIRLVSGMGTESERELAVGV